MSTPLYIVQSEYWIRVNLALEYCIKEALIDVLHNAHNDPSYRGLPTNPAQLYQVLFQCKQDKRKWDFILFLKVLLTGNLKSIGCL